MMAFFCMISRGIVCQDNNVRPMCLTRFLRCSESNGSSNGLRHYGSMDEDQVIYRSIHTIEVYVA
jgi:hypothetical protein